MFGLFKRTKILDWEIRLMKNTLAKLPEEYSVLIDQVNDGLLRSVLVDASDIPGYVAFTFNSDVIGKYERKKERCFKLTNIKVYDSLSATFLLYEIYISSGVINGYSLGGSKKHNIDVSQINVSGFRKVFDDTDDYDRIKHLLTEAEKALLNTSQIYAVKVLGKEYFHLLDLEDGDFIGIDDQKVVYRITHDPLGVSALDKKIADLLN